MKEQIEGMGVLKLREKKDLQIQVQEFEKRRLAIINDAMRERVSTDSYLLFCSKSIYSSITM